jgi:hypothetical protein
MLLTFDSLRAPRREPSAANGAIRIANTLTINEIAVKSPRQEQLAVITNLAILTSLGQTPPLVKRYFLTLAPHEKKNIAAVMANWCENLMRDVERRLGETREVEHASAL